MAKKKTKSKKPAAKKKSAKKPAKKPVKRAAAKAKAKPKAKAKKAPAKKKEAEAALVLPWRVALPGEKFIGVVDDFFSHISVVTIKVTAPLNVGDRIHLRGHTTDVTQAVSSMQVEHAPVQTARPGDGVGIKVDGKSRRGDYVYKVG